jgi:hypothetical protein
MILFPTGIAITEEEYKCLLHIETDPEQWIRDVLNDKAHARRDALINKWRSLLFADPDVGELPANADDLAQLIMSRTDYTSRAQDDASQIPPLFPARHNIARFAGRVREGLTYRRPERDFASATVTLFPTGVDLPDLHVNCILAYVQDLDDWILGALLGCINQGKKKMIRQYQQVLMDDPGVTAFPATEDGLIEVIVARADYKTLPEQMVILREAQAEEARQQLIATQAKYA